MRTALTSLIAVVLAASAQAADSIADCLPMPVVLLSSSPSYPTDVEPRGRPTPVTVVVELTVSAQGDPSDAVVVENDAGTHAKQFGMEALNAVATWRFKPIPSSCRGRVRVVFKVAS
jgi:TonB family protein